LYFFVRIWLRIALHFYCGAVRFAQKDKSSGMPIILAANHPNSFFDALIIAAHYPREIHFLARGDAFNKPFAAWVLRKLNLIPIYRLSEGKENLGNNEVSFAECVKVFSKGGVVLIFSEGLSVHEWKIRPLKKGTARLAYLAWQQHNINDLLVQPVSLSYHSYHAVPKNVIVDFGTALHAENFKLEHDAVFYNDFNRLLEDAIESKMILKKDGADITGLIPHSQSNIILFVLAVPAFLGYITQRWFYVFWRNFAQKKTKGTVFYDSVLFTTMMLTYPLLVFIVSIIFFCITGNHLWWLLMIILPFTALAYKEYKYQKQQ
jgi:1-acyl-sn-glycerol-3-phosphate acyltransferase